MPCLAQEHISRVEVTLPPPPAVTLRALGGVAGHLGSTDSGLPVPPLLEKLSSLKQSVKGMQTRPLSFFFPLVQVSVSICILKRGKAECELSCEASLLAVQQHAVVYQPICCKFTLKYANNCKVKQHAQERQKIISDGKNMHDSHVLTCELKS